MTEKEKYKLSTYEPIKVIHETKASKVELVECSLDGKKYIKKTYHSDKRAVFNIIADIKNEHIPEIYEIIFGEDTIIIEQYIEGKTLAQEISEGKVFSKAQIKTVFGDLTEAVDALHKNNIVHRDIKPSNIIIKENGDAVLIDYSIARPYSEKRNADTELFGTVGYAAPEQFGFSQSDFRTDIYALGVTMKEIANRHNTSKRLYSAISRCTEFDPSRRFQTIDELRKYINDSKKHIAVVGTVVCLTAVSVFAVICVCLNSVKENNDLSKLSEQYEQTLQASVSESETEITTSEVNSSQSETQSELPEKTTAVSSEEMTGMTEESYQQTLQTSVSETETTASVTTAVQSEQAEKTAAAVSDKVTTTIEEHHTQTVQTTLQTSVIQTETTMSETVTSQEDHYENEDTDIVIYEPYSDRIVNTSNVRNGVPCIQMWNDEIYKAEISVGDDTPPIRISAQKSGSKCTVTVNNEMFSFEDTFIPEAYSYSDSSKFAEIIFYDMNCDGILDIMPVICDARIVSYYDGDELLENYTVAWCIYSDTKGNYKLAKGEMYAYVSPFKIYDSSPGCLYADFPNYYTLEDGEMVLQ